jgi:DNA-binding PadR family transcriptional regulator
MPKATQADSKHILPLSPAMFYILLALPDGPKHGYAIMKEVEEMTEGKITLGPGSLYGSIKRLLQARMIVETDHRPIRALDDERRRYYDLTDYGRKVLAGEVERLASAVRMAQKKAVRGRTI